MIDDLLNELPKREASAELVHKLTQDGRANMTRRAVRRRITTQISAFAIAASLALGLVLGATDFANFGAQNLELDEFALLAQDADVYGTAIAELGS